MSIRVAIAEDQHLIRELLAGVLAREPGVEIVAEASTGAEAIALAESAQPDILLLDVSLPDLDGMEVARSVRKLRPGPAILALSMHEEPHFVRSMLQAGADGYVVKSGTVAELVQAMHAVRQGRMYLSPSVTRYAVTADAGVAQLSGREREVVVLIANGFNSRAIAVKLHISKSTVEVHRRNIMTKLGMHSIADLTKYAVREGLTSSLWTTPPAVRRLPPRGDSAGAASSLSSPAMTVNPLYAECVRRSAALVGGYAALGARLGVPKAQVERWAAGRSVVPERAFLRVVDILLENDAAPKPPAGTDDTRRTVR